MKRVLIVVAHPDDEVLGCGGTIAKLVDQNCRVKVIFLSDGESSRLNKKSLKKNTYRRNCAIKAMKVLGIKKLYSGKFKTLKVEFNEELNVEILKIIEKHKIDLIYGHWVGDVHHDHQAVGKSTLHSARHVKNILLYRSNWYDSSLNFNGNFYIDISKTWEIKKRSIEMHKSEMERTGKKWIKFFHNEAINAGQKINVKYAEVFEVVKFVN